jgi:hypothetical protein
MVPREVRSHRVDASICRRLGSLRDSQREPASQASEFGAPFGGRVPAPLRRAQFAFPADGGRSHSGLSAGVVGPQPAFCNRDI